MSRKRYNEYLDRFDCQAQVEEVYNPLLIPEEEDEESEDIMDRPVLSLDYIKQHGGAGSYDMEDAVIEAEELDWLCDSNRYHNELEGLFGLRKVGAAW